ncbi:hypothetical protein EV286_11448 [Rhizobium sp. BK251]|nr:hypothetical protein EV286_11448 [Rhizobium sp. BK251]
MKLRAADEQQRTLSKSEKTARATNDAAWEIIEQERARTDAKSERLRQARLASEALEADKAKTATKAKRKSGKSASSETPGR